MSCRICGRRACTESFHSFEEQEEADKQRKNKKESEGKELKCSTPPKTTS